MLLSPTRRGARLARLLSTAHLGDWGLPTGAAAHIVAELATNAVLHGRAEGRDFRLRLTVHRDAVLRIEVTDARGERLPPAPGTVVEAGGEAESGRSRTAGASMPNPPCARRSGPNSTSSGDHRHRGAEPEVPGSTRRHSRG